MAKVQNPKSDKPTRSESLSRMLELEKKYKMQRVHGNGSGTLSPPGPSSTSSEAAQLNSSVKARRGTGGGLPPLSHQAQMTKAVRRSSALPSLSLSIPPSPTSTSTAAVRADDPTQKPAPVPQSLKEPPREPTKTVTFSQPEEVETELSDDSSICQSPIWEGYGQRKKKAKKREAEQKKEKEREEKANKDPKKKQSRLSKAPPQDAPAAKLLLSILDRSVSTPELEPRPKLTERPLNRSTTEYPPDSMANHQHLTNQVSNVNNGKTKRRGFLSSFRSSSRNSIDNAQALKSAGADLDLAKSRKAASINSNVSASTKSMASQEKRPGLLSRSSTSSAHGRNQSFLSRLKGPSYLYHNGKNSADTDTGDSDPSQRPSNSQKIEAAMPPAATSQELSHPPPATTASTVPEAPEAQVLRGRPANLRTAQPRDSSSDYAESDHPQPRAHLPKESSPAAPIANEGRRRPYSHLGNVRQQTEDTKSHSMTRQTDGRIGVAIQAQRPHRQHPRSSQTVVHAELKVEVQEPEARSAHSAQSEDFASPYTEEIDRLAITHTPHGENGEVSPGSTFRPVSHCKERVSPEPSKKASGKTISPTPSAIGKARVHNGGLEGREEERMIMKSGSTAKDIPPPAVNQRPLRPEKSSDYFTFITESYAPPSLELNSPAEKNYPSPRIQQESEDDGEGDESWARLPWHSEQRNKHHGTPTESNIQVNSAKTDVTTEPSSQSKQDLSPAMSANQVEKNRPDFENLGIAPKAAKVLGEVSMTSEPSEEQASRSTSERSSASTYDDVHPSSSNTTTPDNSRPQSRRGVPGDSSKSASSRSAPNTEDATPKRLRHTAVADHQPISSTPRSASREAKPQEDSWSRTALPIELDHPSPPTAPFARMKGLGSSPSLVSTPASVTFADASKETKDEDLRAPRRPSLPPKAQSAIDLTATSFLPPLKHQPLFPKKNHSKLSSSLSLPNSPPSELDTDLVAPRATSALKMSRNSSSDSSTGAAYLQEARKTAPVPAMSSSRALRPIYSHKNSLPHIRNAMSPEKLGEPIAKMLVECCNCKFLHDMPSRVYECMAKPDSVVEDKLLGVSATITTMVKCPWCAHGMTTQCCAGYAAVVYLKEKLHGK